MIERKYIHELAELCQYFLVIGIIGPRQVGKTTLVKGFMNTPDKHAGHLNLQKPSDIQKRLRQSFPLHQRWPRELISLWMTWKQNTTMWLFLILILINCGMESLFVGFIIFWKMCYRSCSLEWFLVSCKWCLKFGKFYNKQRGTFPLLKTRQIWSQTPYLSGI